MNTAKRISVLLADDHMRIREGLRTLLRAESDIEVVGEAATGRQAVELTGNSAPTWSSRTSRCRRRTACQRLTIITPPSIIDANNDGLQNV